MQLHRGLSRLRADLHPDAATVATIGAFDGVHQGHQAVIEQLLEQGAAHNATTVLVTFEPLPREFFAGDNAPARLQSFRERFEAIAAAGVDRLLCLRFNEALRTMSAETFARSIFVDGLGVRSIVLGDDFRFGHDREGDAEFMRRLGLQEGFEIHPTRTRELQGERISSSRLRRALQEADFELAEALLGRPFSLSGRVIYGRQLGRTIGAPTANIALRRRAVPLRGVYAVSVDTCDGGSPLRGLNGVANVGVRPTIADALKPNLEVHLLDCKLDVYGRRLRVSFRKMLRDEQRFDSLEELKAQIDRDRIAARAFFRGQ
ncbi:MAG: bifunctional riboflavin kinase/FAD synthetase [Pseudomonadota bacterium]